MYVLKINLTIFTIFFIYIMTMTENINMILPDHNCFHILYLTVLTKIRSNLFDLFFSVRT